MSKGNKEHTFTIKMKVTIDQMMDGSDPKPEDIKFAVHELLIGWSGSIGGCVSKVDSIEIEKKQEVEE